MHESLSAKVNLWWHGVALESAEGVSGKVLLSWQAMLECVPPGLPVFRAFPHDLSSSCLPPFPLTCHEHCACAPPLPPPPPTTTPRRCSPCAKPAAATSAAGWP